MVIISDYTLSSISDTLILVESKCESFCPQCGMELTYRDSRKRIKKEEGGNNRFLIIRRLRCDQCHRLHNELPDCVVPHKHYSTDVISGVLDEVIHPDDAECEMYPCETTMNRWKHWMMANQDFINRCLACRNPLISEITKNCQEQKKTVFSKIREKYRNWLEMILRIIYNSGRSLNSF